MARAGNHSPMDSNFRGRGMQRVDSSFSARAKKIVISEGRTGPGSFEPALEPDADDFPDDGPQDVETEFRSVHDSPELQEMSAEDDKSKPAEDPKKKSKRSQGMRDIQKKNKGKKA
jgi:hypothetical protein